MRGIFRGHLIRSERGQASLMIGTMMLTFILFFAFVVNTGMLVNAKINLQNAADLAAYAGASTQARQLTQISYLNYEMRRQFKKFLFRYYVIGNMAQASFPRGGGGMNPHVWSPDSQGSKNYQVPTVCLIFDNPNDNYCQLDVLPQIANVPTNPLDSINSTLHDQLAAIEAIRRQNCGKIADTNLRVLLLWLYNTDPALERLPTAIQDPDVVNQLKVVRAIGYGLGLVPREIILRQRIQTLAGYVNQAALSGISRGRIEALKQDSDPASFERSIQAFLSAYYTLGNWTFDGGSISMDELLPGSTDSAQLLSLQDIKQDFDAYATRYVNPSGSGDCLSQLTPVSARNVPLGVAKDPSVLTYYAVRLKARAKVMFSPFGDIELKAYAAARPFGSRIGPPSATFTFPFTPSNPYISPIPGQNPTGFIPNLPIGKDENTAFGQGWDTDFALGAFYSAISGGTGTGVTSPVGAQDFLNGVRLAMAPNPFEGNLYNIINDNGNDPFVRNFDAIRQSSFWAPVVPPSKQAQINDLLKAQLDQIFQTPPASSPMAGTNAAGTANLRTTILNDLANYIETLRQGKGEQIAPGVNEGMNVVHLQDPFSGEDGKPITLPPTLALNTGNTDQYKTSFVSELDDAVKVQGRVGYSVKFISFDSLIHKKVLSNGQSSPGNTSAFLDDESASDLGRIQH